MQQSAEHLGFLITTKRNENHLEDLLKQRLSDAKQAGYPLNKIIDHPIERYGGRTLIHLATAKGLLRCLEILLEKGGKLNE